MVDRSIRRIPGWLGPPVPEMSPLQKLLALVHAHYMEYGVATRVVGQEYEWSDLLRELDFLAEYSWDRSDINAGVLSVRENNSRVVWTCIMYSLKTDEVHQIGVYWNELHTYLEAYVVLSARA